MPEPAGNASQQLAVIAQHAVDVRVLVTDSGRNESFRVIRLERSVESRGPPQRVQRFRHGHRIMTVLGAAAARSTLSAMQPGFLPGAEHFGDAPRLRDAPAGQERRLRIENLADRPDASFAEMIPEPRKQRVGAVAVLRMHLEPGIDIWTDQPGPYRALVIRGVSRSEITVIP